MESNENKEEINFDVKHPLQDSWTWWYDNPRKKVSQHSWGDALKRVYDFSTVEDFWCLWNNIKAANEMPPGSDYHLFKQGIEPKWEDAANAKGGKWVFNLKKGQRDALSDHWLHTVLAVIGSYFEDSEEITGCVVSVRKNGDRIAVWTRDASNEAVCVRVGQQFKDALGLSQPISYQAHEDAKLTPSHNTKARYEL